MVKRGKLEVIKDMLKIIQENKNSIKPTPLLRKANISSKGFKKYCADLLDKKLIAEVVDENGDKLLVLAERGFKFLERYKYIIDFIDEFEL